MKWVAWDDAIVGENERATCIGPCLSGAGFYFRFAVHDGKKIDKLDFSRITTRRHKHGDDEKSCLRNLKLAPDLIGLYRV